MLTPFSIKLTLWCWDNPTEMRRYNCLMFQPPLLPPPLHYTCLNARLTSKSQYLRFLCLCRFINKKKTLLVHYLSLSISLCHSFCSMMELYAQAIRGRSVPSAQRVSFGIESNLVIDIECGYKVFAETRKVDRKGTAKVVYDFRSQDKSKTPICLCVNVL